VNRVAATLMGAALTWSASGAGAVKPAARDLPAMLAKAAEFCEGAASRDAGSGIPMLIDVGISVHDGAPPAMGVPDIVKRFAQTQLSSRIAATPPFYLRFAAAKGDVWAVVYDKLPSCDLMVTGADGDMPTLAAALSRSLTSHGWTLLKSIPATATSPLAEQLLVRTMSGNRGLRVIIRALAPAPADKAGVQMELSFLAGEANTPPR
jgi:hypothetical protein